jgi:hypothetical protein
MCLSKIYTTSVVIISYTMTIAENGSKQKKYVAEASHWYMQTWLPIPVVAGVTSDVLHCMVHEFTM